MKIPLEDFSGEILLIGDTYGDDVGGVDWGADHGGLTLIRRWPMR